MSLSKGIQSAAAAALSAAMLIAVAACGTSDSADTASKSADSKDSSSTSSTQGFDTSGIKKDDEIAALLPDSVAGAGPLTAGAHTSIPAPGLGALAAGMGGKDSKLVRDLAKLGVSADDIAVVSKHDTSTNANDPNESELHNTLAHAIGRTDGNPLFVISQKTLTGHAKGGACIFQVNGLTQLFKSGVIPANASLDCVDPKLQRDDHMVWVRKPLRIGGGEAMLEWHDEWTYER